MSTLTVLLCNYNHGRLIGRALDALVTQSRSADEILVVDDGSTDDSVAVIESYVARHPIIRLIRNERNLGFHASATKGIAAAKGDYLYSGAADDYVLPGFFEGACGLLDRFPQAGVVCGKVITATPDGRHLRSDGLQRFDAPTFLDPARYLTDVLQVEPPTFSLSAGTIYRREALFAVGGWRAELGSWADTFSIEAIALQRGLCYLPQDVVVWFVNPQGMSQTVLQQPQRQRQIIRTAAALMRSTEFGHVFPANYVTHWEAASMEALIRQPLQPAVDGYQAVQATLRDVAAQSGGGTRLLLGLLRRVMTVSYLACHTVALRALRRSLRD